MNENEQYIADVIRLAAWSGFQSRTEVEEGIYDIIEQSDDKDMLLSLVGETFEGKLAAEQAWDAITDVDKLDAAFNAIRDSGVLALHNAGWDKSEAFQACLEQYRSEGSPQELFGICYYTSQDVEGAIDNHYIFLGVSSTRPETEAEDALRAAKLICEEIGNQGLIVEWDGDVSRRIKVKMRWEKRASPASPISTPETSSSQSNGLIGRLIKGVFGR